MLKLAAPHPKMDPFDGFSFNPEPMPKSAKLAPSFFLPIQIDQPEIFDLNDVAGFGSSNSISPHTLDFDPTFECSSSVSSGSSVTYASLSSSRYVEDAFETKKPFSESSSPTTGDSLTSALVKALGKRARNDNGFESHNPHAAFVSSPAAELPFDNILADVAPLMQQHSFLPRHFASTLANAPPTSSSALKALPHSSGILRAGSTPSLPWPLAAAGAMTRAKTATPAAVEAPPAPPSDAAPPAKKPARAKAAAAPARTRKQPEAPSAAAVGVSDAITAEGTIAVEPTSPVASTVTADVEEGGVSVLDAENIANMVVLPKIVARAIGRKGRIPFEVAYCHGSEGGLLHPVGAKTVGVYSMPQRAERLAAWADLRARRIFYKKVKYRMRHALANGRQRIKGRFVKDDTPGAAPPVAPLATTSSSSPSSSAAAAMRAAAK